MPHNHLWWQRGVVYQVYPRSFMDSNGDGIGDLRGVESRLDHLTWLGVDALWLSPIFPSPMADFGYDVSDYVGVHPIFGTMEDFDRLLKAVHQRGLKLLLDLVPNHTSNEHPWFLESRSSRTSPKRDWYIWRDPAPDGGAPNNWLSVFGGSGWEFDQATGQFYYHAFLKEQPDLNWRNPEVEKAVLDSMRFWLDKGVDGFRVDVMWHMIKDAQFRDNPVNPDFKPGMSPYERLIPAFSTDQEEVHGVVARMRRVMGPEHVLIGEIYLPIDKLVEYYGQHGSGAHLPFNFMLLNMPWNAQMIGAAVAKYEGSLPPYGWPNWVLGNHDKQRVASRVGEAQARVAAMLLLTLRGTPTLYYGDEIGMQDVPIPPEKVQDPQEKNVPGLGLGRDPERTPMQWDASPNAGFSTAEPWLPLADDYERRNVALQKDDPDSMLMLHRRLLDLRRREGALSVGAYRPVIAERRDESALLAFVREHEGRRLLVVLNLGHEPEFLTPQQFEVKGRVLVGTDRHREGQEVGPRVTVHGDEGLVIELPG